MDRPWQTFGVSKYEIRPSRIQQIARDELINLQEPKGNSAAREWPYGLQKWVGNLVRSEIGQ